MSVLRLCIGGFAEPPGHKRECLEAIWTQGRACKRCRVSECYRHGWEKARVDADNKRIVRGGTFKKIRPTCYGDGDEC